MRRYNIEITELAEQDLEDIGDYIAFVLMNTSAAKNTIQGIRRTIKTLELFPERNEIVSDVFIMELSIRMVMHKKYKIYYAVDDDSQVVYIVRILHELMESSTRLYFTVDSLQDSQINIYESYVKEKTKCTL